MYILISIVTLSVLAFAILRPIRVLPRIELAPGFSFTNQFGDSRNSDDFRGQVTIISFTSLALPQESQAGLSEMRNLYQRLLSSDSNGLKISVVTIAVDPPADATSALKELASQYCNSPKNAPEFARLRWDFLGGEALLTKQVVGGGFGVYYTTAEQVASGKSKPMLDQRLVIVDGWGIIRANYSAYNLSADRVMRDLNYLATEARNSKGVAKLAYEAAHLFRCYS